MAVAPAPRFTAVLLCAGYGTRLARDIDALPDPDDPMKALLTKPKGLLPVDGIPLLDHWLGALRRCPLVGDVVVVTNAVFHAKFLAWASVRGIPAQHVVSDGTSSNVDRLGAVADLAFAIRHAGVVPGSDVLVVAGDTMFYDDFVLDDFLGSLPSGAGGVVYYDLVDPEETRKRGIIETEPADAGEVVVRLLEKPEPAATASRKACPAFYAYTAAQVGLIEPFLAAKKAAGAPLSEIDAPGKLLAHLVGDPSGGQILARQVSGRFDIGSLSQYRDTLAHFAARNAARTALLPTRVQERCNARVGLLGNPSDGYGGTTLALTFTNYKASVTVEAAEGGSVAFELTGDQHATSYRSTASMLARFDADGVYDARRLLNAATSAFLSRCRAYGVVVDRGFVMAYDTDIPRRCGLAGSSAILVSSLRALFSFFGVTLCDVGLTLDTLPTFVLRVETEILGIAAGYQDRVVQCRGGLVLMDFGSIPKSSPRGLNLALPSGKYENIDAASLPKLYLAFSTQDSEDSGVVHSDVRQRYAAADPVVVGGMQALALLPGRGAAALAAGDKAQFAQLMRENFRLRRDLFGDAVIGKRALAFVALADSFNLAAKFGGSGGAFVCAHEEGGWMEPWDEAALVKAGAEAGWEVVRLEPGGPTMVPAGEGTAEGAGVGTGCQQQ